MLLGSRYSRSKQVVAQAGLLRALEQSPDLADRHSFRQGFIYLSSIYLGPRGTNTGTILGICAAKNEKKRQSIVEHE